jgi:hypothetical protein
MMWSSHSSPSTRVRVGARAPRPRGRRAKVRVRKGVAVAVTTSRSSRMCLIRARSTGRLRADETSGGVLRSGIECKILGGVCVWSLEGLRVMFEYFLSPDGWLSANLSILMYLL